MSNPKHRLLEWIILAALIIAAVLAGVWILGCRIANEVPVAGSAAVGNAAEHEAHTASQNKYNAMSDEKADRFSDVSDINSDRDFFEAAAPRKGKQGYAPSFGGRQPGSGQQSIRASTVEDDSPIPPDGGDSILGKLAPSSNK